MIGTHSSSGFDSSLRTGNKNGVCAKHCITALKKHVLPKLDKPRTRGNLLISLVSTRFAWPGIFGFELNECTILMVFPRSERIASLLISAPSPSAFASPFTKTGPIDSPFSNGIGFDVDAFGLDNSDFTKSMHCCKLFSMFTTSASQS